MERKLLNVTLEDVKNYVRESMTYGIMQYVMLENDGKGNKNSNAEIYIDNLGTDRPFCSNTCFGRISPENTFQIMEGVENWIDYEEFCKALYNYIVEEYQYVLNF